MEEIKRKREKFLEKKNKCINDWVNNQLNAFKGSQRDVLEFIANILFQQGDEGSETIRFLFHAGYCYYFAKMLEDAFGGEASWHKGFSHIVWKDTREGEGQNIFYDIEGVFYDYEDEDDFTSVKNLGSSLESFRHRGMDGKINEEISNFAKVNKITEKELIEIVYQMIPEKERIINTCNKGDVTRVWDKYKDKIIIPKKENPLEEYIFTFGSSQPLEGFYIRIKGKSYASCRKEMIKYFGTRWAFQYPVDEWNNWLKKAKKMGIKLEQEILTLQEEEEVNWNYIEKNNKETYPENNQDVLVWDEYYGYNVCAYYEGIFEDKHGNTYKNVLGWVPVPEPIERKRAF